MVRQAVTDRNKKIVLKAFKECCLNVCKTCEKTNTSRANFYTWKEDDPDFAQALIDIEEELLDSCESTVYSRGQEKSDTLLIFALKHKRAHIWGDKAGEKPRDNGGVEPYDVWKGKHEG